MTVHENYIGLQRTAYSDGDVYPDTGQPIDAARFGGNVQITGTPTEDNHAVTKGYLAAWLQTLGTYKVPVVDIDDPENELEELDADNSSSMIVAVEGNDFTIYAWAESGAVRNSPYVVNGAGGSFWVAVGGKYSNMNPQLAVGPALHENQAVRMHELNKRVQLVTVADTYNPVELATLSGQAAGDILIAYHQIDDAAQATIYAWQPGTETAEAKPEIVAGTGGYWVAIGGNHTNDMCAVRLVKVANHGDPTELAAFKGSKPGELILAWQDYTAGQTAYPNLATLYMWDEGITAGESKPHIVAGVGGAGFWVAIAGSYVCNELYVKGTLNCEAFACTNSTYTGTVQHVKTTQAIAAAGDTILPVARLVELGGTPVVFTSTPTITDGVEGQRLTLVSKATEAAAFVLTDHNELGGTDLELGVPYCAVCHGSPLELIFHNGKWVKISTPRIFRRVRVANIADPSAELANYAGDGQGDLILCFQPIGTIADRATLYMWDSTIAAAHAPNVVAGANDGGFWVAIAGYIHGAGMYVSGLVEAENLTASLGLIIGGTLKTTKATQAINAATDQIDPVAALVELTTDAAVTFGSTPTIKAGTIDGQILILVSSTDSGEPVRLQDNGTLANSKLSLGAATRDISLDGLIVLIYYAGHWRELSYTAGYTGA